MLEFSHCTLVDNTDKEICFKKSIIGLVVEFIVAIDEARVRFTDDAHSFCLFIQTIEYISNSLINFLLCF